VAAAATAAFLFFWVDVACFGGFVFFTTLVVLLLVGFVVVDADFELVDAVFVFVGVDVLVFVVVAFVLVLVLVAFAEVDVAIIDDEEDEDEEDEEPPTAATLPLTQYAVPAQRLSQAASMYVFQLMN
jgi:hypothetical protein